MTESDIVAGALLGLALGDAAGAALEMAGRERAQAAAAALHVDAALQAGWQGDGGQVTDDTQSAVLLARSLAEQQRWEPADFARRLAQHVTSSRAIGFGPSTKQAALRLAMGVPWHDAGTPGPLVGNGAAMRIVPAAVALRHDPALRARMTAEQSVVTHRAPLAHAMAEAAAVLAIAAAGQGGDERWLADGVASAADAAGAVEPAAGRLVTWALAAADLDDATALQALLDLGVDPNPHASMELGLSGHAAASVTWALRAAIRGGHDVLAVVRIALGCGGDVDTTAAIAGAIVGARVGASALPAALVAQLHDHDMRLASPMHRLAADLVETFGPREPSDAAHPRQESL